MKYPSAWQIDGSLRDIYVLNTNLQDWQIALDFLRETYHPTYKIDGVDVPPFTDVITVFKNRNEQSYLMAIQVEEVNIHCHFFLTRLIEFDIDPREIDNETKEDAILNFMRGLVETLAKEVVLTVENMEGGVLLRVSPGRSEPEYTPGTSEPGKTMSREEALRSIARFHGIDENDHEAIIERMIESANLPYE